jgi:hypothetical protein
MKKIIFHYLASVTPPEITSQTYALLIRSIVLHLGNL